jgi:hypothetical protein
MHACGLANVCSPFDGGFGSSGHSLRRGRAEVSAAVAGVVEFLAEEQRRIVSAVSGRVLRRSRVYDAARVGARAL